MEIARSRMRINISTDQMMSVITSGRADQDASGMEKGTAKGEEEEEGTRTRKILSMEERTRERIKSDLN